MGKVKNLKIEMEENKITLKDIKTFGEKMMKIANLLTTHLNHKKAFKEIKKAPMFKDKKIDQESFKIGYYKGASDAIEYMNELEKLKGDKNGRRKKQ